MRGIREPVVGTAAYREWGDGGVRVGTGSRGAGALVGAAQVAEGSEDGRRRLFDRNAGNLKGGLGAGLWGRIAAADGASVGDDGRSRGRFFASFPVEAGA